MSLYLRQSTASQEILLGPFVDSGDGNTAETSLTIANTDIKLWVEGATTLANKNSGGATHISNGYYYAVLDATDTATVGKLEVNVKVSGALAVKREFHVLEEAVYDAMFAASGTGVPAALSSLIATAQADLDIITGSDGATLATSQPNLLDIENARVTLAASQPDYAPAKAGDQMDLVASPNSTARTAFATTLLGTNAATGITVAAAMTAAWAQGYGKWVLSGTTITLYAPDGTTPLRAFTVDSASSPTSRTPA